MMSSLDKDFEFPAELLVQPQALVGITGLDTLNNAVHRSVWDALSASRRSDRPPVQFKLLAASHEFPRPKPKKSYDQHIPKGILKRGWMHKHLTQIPSVVVVFADLDWDDPQWEERKIECASKIQSIRLALVGRGTRVCLVLIQRDAPNPVVEDVLGAERAKEIFQAADLTNKSLYILPHNDHLLGCTAKLENVFYDLAKNYYHHEIRQIKIHRENLNKKNHQYLYVRHHFKIGFFSELRQELVTAHCHYEEAYNSLLEARLLDTNEFEVKTVAGYISYKVSHVHFAQNRPRDAISHFKAHIEHYRHRMGHALLLFQHYAWLSKQFSMFAELLEEVAHQGYPPMQTQHPGFYYRSAAKYSEHRKRIARQLCKNIATYPEPDPLANWDKLEFYGQRPWRPCQLSAEPLDPDLERQGILALQHNENHKVDHSAIIIGLLGNAISQFKKYKCPRMRRHLVIQMADEYYEAKDYGKSLTLLTHMLWDYRVEKWYTIVDKLLVKALTTAYLSAAVSEYLTLCLEAVSRAEHPEALRIIHNLITVTQGGAPHPEPNLPISEVAGAEQKWAVARSEAPTVNVDTSLFVPPIQLKAAIVIHEYNNLRVCITVRSHLPEVIAFSSFKVCLSHGSQIITEHNVTTSDQTLVPKQLLTYYCDIFPEPSDVGKYVQIVSIQLSIGKIVGRTVVLSFNGLGTDPNSTYPELMFFKQVKGQDLEFLKIKPCLSSVISRRDSLISLKCSYKSPALLQEWYPIKVVLENRETSPVSDAFLTINLAQNTDQVTTQATELSQVNTPLSFPANISVVISGPKHELWFFVKCATSTSRQLDVRFSYIVEGHCCISEAILQFDVREPFVHTCKYFGENFDMLENLFTSDIFRIENKVTNVSPWPLVISSAQIEVIGSIKKEGKWFYKTEREGLQISEEDPDWGFEPDPKCHIEGVTLGENECAVDVLSAVASVHAYTPLGLGTLHLTWFRNGEPESIKTTKSTFLLPEVKIIESQLSIRVDAPGDGFVRQFYPFTYSLINRSNRLHVLHLSVEPSENFLFAGPNECDIYLQPGATKVLMYKMFPLICGKMKLPNVQIRSTDNSIPHLDEIVARAVPELVFILPQSRSLTQPEK